MKNGVCLPPSSFFNAYICALNFVCGVIVPGFANTIPRSTSSLSVPLNNIPTLSPAYPFIQYLPKHLYPRHHSLPRLTKSYDLYLLSYLHLPSLHPARHNRPASAYRKNVLYRHQKRLIHQSHRLRNIANPPHPSTPVSTCSLPASGSPSDSNDFNALPLTTGMSSPGNSYFVNNSRTSKLHQIQYLRIIHQIRLVHVHHYRRHIHLTRQQYVLPRLRHRPIIGRHHQYRSVHLRRPRDHVLDVIRMTRTIYVRIMTIVRLILNVRYLDRQTPLLLLRRIVNLIIINKRYLVPSSCSIPSLSPPSTSSSHDPHALSSLCSNAASSAQTFAFAICFTSYLMLIDIKFITKPTTRLELVTPSLPRTCSTN